MKSFSFFLSNLLACSRFVLQHHDNDLLSVDRRLNSVIVRNEVDYTGFMVAVKIPLLLVM